MLNLNTKINQLSGVGTTTAKRLEILDIYTINDLLFYFPFRYEDFREQSAIKSLRAGLNINIEGTVDMIQNKRTSKKRMNLTEAIVSDESGKIKVIWFNQPFIAKNLKVGDKISLAGKVDNDGWGSLVMKSPTYEKIGTFSGHNTQGLVPNYRLTANITQKQIRYLVQQVIKSCDLVIDWLPEEIRKSNDLVTLPQALRLIHKPQSYDDIEVAKKRLGFNELFLLQLETLLSHQELEKIKAPSLKFKKKHTQEFVKSLPFQLTDAQKRSAWEILLDMEKNKPMSRLLEGDVGSGKTVVACLAMLNTAVNKKQAVLMVPTEILALQHYEGVLKLFKNSEIKFGLITRVNKKLNIELKQKKLTPQLVADNADIIIGTHALIQEKVKYQDLALAIIDEQHRFGVEQRKMLIEKANKKNTSPHLLSMTATPIPRSLALALYGDLKLSIINELPKGRKKIITSAVPENKRESAYKFIREQVASGRQVFVVCPLVDVSDKLGVKSVKEEYKKLNEQVFPDLKIAFIHGKMKPTEKERIMQDFVDNKINILVSTSVIEVGVDVPNATIMLIEGADRFGLAQLHQFRGRVGRSDLQSYCFLFSDNTSPKTMKRLNALSTHHNGFDLAKIDLSLRGPGEVYGIAQSGFPDLNIASIFDHFLMKSARDTAENLLKKDPELKKSPLLKDKLNISIKHLE